MSAHKHYFLLSLGVVLIDQATKLWTHYHIDLGIEGQVVLINDWLKIHYTINDGMAFGLQSGISPSLLFLIRFIVVLFLGFFTHLLAYHRVRTRVVWSMALILGGAIGNLTDTAFYGVAFQNSGGWFNGQVIDLIYFDLWKGIVPAQVPLLGGKYLTVLPIFNLADLAIFVGVISVLFTTRPYKGATIY